MLKARIFAYFLYLHYFSDPHKWSHSPGAHGTAKK